jgi:hypothetical protein
MGVSGTENITKAKHLKIITKKILTKTMQGEKPYIKYYRVCLWNVNPCN